MIFKQGATRFVLLVGNKAIKIGKIRLLRFVLRMLAFPFSSYQRRRFYQKYGDNFLQASFNDIFRGLLANRIEYQYYQTTLDKRVAPTRAQYLWGFITIQERGDPVRENDIWKLEIVNAHRAELASHLQFCKSTKGDILLVDYGNSDTCDALQNTLSNNT